MSIASIGLINTLELNNVNLGTNGQITSQGTIGNLNINNDLIPNLGVPNVTWTMGAYPSTNPNFPNALEISVISNNPVSPTQPTLIMEPSGGGATGNGTQTAVGGDLVVDGDILTQITNASSLKTDSNGKIIAGSAIPIAEPTKGLITGGQTGLGVNIFDPNVPLNDNSYYVRGNGMFTIYFNISGAIAPGITFVSNSLNDFFNVNNNQTAIPPVNSDYVQGNGGANPIIGTGAIYVEGGQFTTVIFQYQQSGIQSSLVNQTDVSTIVSAGDKISVVCTVSFPI